MSEDFDIALLSVIGQLVEARDDQSDAERRLREYRAAETPPEIPNEFEDVDAFLDYHHCRQSYENHLRQHENALKTAEREYTEALPSTCLFSCPMACLYVISTKASELVGAEYVFVRKQGEIVIENPSRVTS